MATREVQVPTLPRLLLAPAHYLQHSDWLELTKNAPAWPNKRNMKDYACDPITDACARSESKSTFKIKQAAEEEEETTFYPDAS